MRKLSLGLLLLAACSGAETFTPAPEQEVKQAKSEIIGGITDTRRDYVVGVGTNGKAFCTGTLISKRVVVTAGHCFGGINTVTLGTKLEGKTLRVKREVRHPQFDENTMAHDMTLLELEEDAPIQAAPLLRENMNENEASFVGPKLTFVGYGVSNGTFQTGFGTRRVATFSITAVGPAKLQNGVTVNEIDDTMFYYRLSDKNTCNGDSGGPAFITRGLVEEHAGVTSFGDARCVKDGVQQRTDLPAIESFIQPFIDEVEGDNPCRSNGVCDESCNAAGTLGDPDCAAAHCEQDGICVLSCTSKVDPDCAGSVCAADGVCDPSCATADSDCQ